MACVCCYYKDGNLIAAQILSVIALAFACFGNILAAVFAGLAMILLMTAACCDVGVSVLYTAVVFSIVAIVGEVLSIVFAEDIAEDWCENDDGSIDDGGICEESNVIVMAVVGMMFSILTGSLTFYFAHTHFRDERGAHAEPTPTTAVIVQPSDFDVDHVGVSKA